MIPPELVAEIRRLYYAEHWKVGTIAAELRLHYDTVRRALAPQRRRRPSKRKTKTAPYLEFIQQTLEKYPRLRATRIYQMIRDRGYTGGIAQVRRLVCRLRPRIQEAFVRLQAFPGEQAQVDWAHFGLVRVGQALRRLSCFVLTLAYSRAFHLEFFFDQGLENFLTAHVRAFHDLGGCTRNVLYDNMKTVVVERYAERARFHPKLLELCAHYHFQPQLCHPYRGNEKGRVERTIRFIREGFFEARPFTNLVDFNHKALGWRNEALKRPHPEHKPRSVLEVFEEEKVHLLPLPQHPFEIELLKPVCSRKTIYVRFDLNDYSIPPQAVGKKLTLAASDTRVRILDGDTVLVTHPRSYHRHELVENPAHRRALLEQKRKAQGSSTLERLRAAVPEVDNFLQQAMDKGESLRTVSQKLVLLLDDYGSHELCAAVQTALERQTPRVSSVAFLLSRRRNRSQQKPLPSVEFEHRPDLAELYVKPHPAESYDELSETDDEDS
jgi:transposase